MRKIWKSQNPEKSVGLGFIAGAIGGLFASCVMDLFIALWNMVERAYKGPPPDEGETAPLGEDATVKTARALAEPILHRELTKAEAQEAGPIVHYAFGAAVGAVYGGVAAKAPMVKTGAGAAWGTAVWLTADETIVPALGLSGPRPEKNAVAAKAKTLGAHLVYGSTTHYVRRLLLRLYRKFRRKF